MAAHILLAVLLAMAVHPQPARGNPRGGPCTYDSYPGTATVIAVDPVPNSPQAAQRTPYQPYRVLYTFEPAVPVPSALHQPGKVHELTLAGGRPPGPAFLRKYRIGPGGSFPALFHVIRTGTCSPVFFTLQRIDVHDTFEFKQ